MDDMHERTLDDLFHEVARTQDTFTIVLPEGQACKFARLLC
jgi:hypothetical protein